MPHRLNRSVLSKIILAAAAIAVTAALAITGAAAATTTGTEHFSLLNISTHESDDYSAIATGAFTAGGTYIYIGATKTFRFQGGTITLKTKATKSKTTTNLKTCLQTAVIPGTYAIASGTGIYDGITGSGKYTFKFTGVGATVNGKCSNNTPADAIQIIDTASGPVSLP